MGSVASRGARGLGLACVLALAGAAAIPHNTVSIARPGEPPWRPLRFPRKTPTRYAPVEIDGVAGVRAESDCAASALAVPVPDLDLEATPRLRWRWRVDAGPEGLNPRVRAGDDFAARVYVSFRFQPERASLWERLKREAAERVYGDELPGRALNYVWCPDEPAGTRWDNPYTDASKMISLGAGPTGTWTDASADVRADYRRSFGEEPPEVLFVALMTDSDDSCTRASAAYADFRFESADAEEKGLEPSDAR